MLYRITHAAPLRPAAVDCSGTIDSAPDRTGREGYLLHLAVGAPMLFAYTGETEGLTLRTSAVRSIRQEDPRAIAVTTRNTVSRLQAVEAAEAEAPLWEEES